VFHEHVRDTDAQLAQLGQRAFDLGGDEVKATRARVQPNVALTPHKNETNGARYSVCAGLPA
jgi:hypothetical protein